MGALEIRMKKNPKFGLTLARFSLVQYQTKMDQNFIFYFYYLIRVEHKKCSEMCAWIVRFAQKLRKWDYF